MNDIRHHPKKEFCETKVNYSFIKLMIITIISVFCLNIKPLIVAADAPNVHIEYEAHVSNIGWMGVVSDGSVAGTTGQNKSIESMAISVKGNNNLSCNYSVYQDKKGWLNGSQGSVAGVTGQSLKLKGIKISLTGNDASKYNVYYRVHM